jgi:hypothetical protein
MLWKLINKETSNPQQRPNIIINTGDKIITNSQMISEKFNSYFTGVIEDLSQANTHNPQQYLSLLVNDCPATMFLAPVTENEVV